MGNIFNNIIKLNQSKRLVRNKLLINTQNVDGRIELYNIIFLIKYFLNIPKDITNIITNIIFHLFHIDLINEALLYKWKIYNKCLYPPYFPQRSLINKITINYKNDIITTTPHIYNKFERRRIQCVLPNNYIL